LYWIINNISNIIIIYFFTDLAVRTDPRLALYKKADREAKEAKRLEKRAAQIAAANEEKRVNKTE